MKKITFLVSVLVLLNMRYSQAASVTWIGGNSTTWSDGANWAGNAAPVAATDTAVFSQNSAYATLPTILNGTSAAVGLSFTGTQATTVSINGTNAQLSIGTGGLSMGVNAGAVSIPGTGTGALIRVVNETWANNSSNLFSSSSQIWSTNAGTRILTLAGTGSGGYDLSGLIRDGNTGTGQLLGITLNTSGSVKLSGTNTYTGGLTVSNGTVLVGNASALGGSTNLVAINGGTVASSSSTTYTLVQNMTVGGNFTLGQSSGGTGALALNGTMNLGGATRQITVANATDTISGVISNGGLTKAGAGKLILSGSNSYIGATLISAGTLVVDGSTNASSAVTVASTGTLGGSGTVNGPVTVQSGGTLSPGNSPGTLTAGSTVLDGGGNYNWQVLDASGAAGTGFDTINLKSGSVLTINSTIGNEFNINLWSLASINPDVNGVASNFNGASNYSWTLIATDQSIVGFSADKFLINTAATNGTGGFSNLFTGTFSVSLADGGTDLVLNYNAVPEPSTWVLVFAGFAVAVLLHRRCHQS